MNHDRHGGWKVRPDDDGFSGCQRWNEQGSVSVEIAAGAFNRFAVIVVREAMHNQRPQLTQNIGRNVARPLGGQNACQSECRRSA